MSDEDDTMSEYNGPEDPQAPQMANQDPEVQLLEVFTYCIYYLEG